MMRKIITLIPSLLIPLWLGGCATQSTPLKYIALDKPQYVITTKDHNQVEEKFDRGGWYSFNYNFRPCPDVKAYLEQAEASANSKILKDADVILNTPPGLSIILVGYHYSFDLVYANRKVQE